MEETVRMTELRRIRREREITQEELAEKAGISRHTLNSIENGRHSPRYKTLSRIADVLGVEVAAIIPKGTAPESDYINKQGGRVQFRTGGSHMEPITASSHATVTVDRALLGAVLHAVEHKSMTADEGERLLAGVGIE